MEKPYKSSFLFLKKMECGKQVYISALIAGQDAAHFVAPSYDHICTVATTPDGKFAISEADKDGTTYAIILNAKDLGKFMKYRGTTKQIAEEELLELTERRRR